MLSRLYATLIFIAVSATAFAADWKPAASPLMTKWGKKVTPDNAWREYPRPQLVRKDWLNLNGLWDYAITAKDAPKPEKWDGQILVPFCVESALSGVGKSVTKDQLLWYRRTVEVPAGWTMGTGTAPGGRRVLIHFGAVDWEATVFVNGKELGVHKGGSDPFSFDITDALKDGKGELVVRVWDPTDSGAQPRGKQQMKPEGIWYTPVTGIWQTVWMEPVNRWGYVNSVRVDTDIAKNEITVHVGMGRTFGNQSTGVEVFDGETVVAKGSVGPLQDPIKIPNAKHWTPDNPHLYRIRLSATGMNANHGSDWVESYFAMRTIAAAKDDKGIPRTCSTASRCSRSGHSIRAGGRMGCSRRHRTRP